MHGSMTIIYTKVRSGDVRRAPGIDVESMAPLTETNCVRRPIEYEDTHCSIHLAFSLLRHDNLSLSGAKVIIDLRCTNVGLILYRMSE